MSIILLHTSGQQEFESSSCFRVADKIAFYLFLFLICLRRGNGELLKHDDEYVPPSEEICRKNPSNGR
ncbi:hypothetical protein PanWU01x14_132530 [Parasponia andersonii]|uniref:Uncharacterized protein n=1 Tax=Parasponia andersonii TaxID=3476 RepID=A0A2P5CQR2_PARAD|nr:hypothetical protein PanWU01x14_132530 [Parasponia andersonii]